MPSNPKNRKSWDRLPVVHISNCLILLRTGSRTTGRGSAYTPTRQVQDPVTKRELWRKSAATSSTGHGYTHCHILPPHPITAGGRANVVNASCEGGAVAHDPGSPASKSGTINLRQRLARRHLRQFVCFVITHIIARSRLGHQASRRTARK